MAAHQPSYAWHDCDDFQMPENSVWFGKDDDGSDIFCGKAWCDGQEVPAKIVPEKKECRVRCDSGEKVVPECRKVLICRRPSDGHCHKRRDHCHRRRHCHRRDDCRCRRDDDCCRRDDDCCRRDCSSSSESEAEDSSHTKTSSSSHNESRVFVKSMKSTSNSTTVTVKKNKTKRRKSGKRGKCGGRSHSQECWNEQRTRVVPRVTYEPRVRYEPRVTMERRVRYEPETYTTRVCAERECERSCYESCESLCEPCEPCEPCPSPRRERRCREAVICERPVSRCEDKEERCIRPDRCSSPPAKGKCW